LVGCTACRRQPAGLLVLAEIGLTALATNWIKRMPPGLIEGLIDRTRLDLTPFYNPVIEDR
jgi:hypothetical protein